VSERSYMSIGDVLSLLRREFPDVTISKIRFLESQGLVDPERTPSGYRKFYDHDVERLRWVLRQQREHFLPLKVIKGRLEEESSPSAPNGRESAAPSGGGARPAERSGAASAVRRGGREESAVLLEDPPPVLGEAPGAAADGAPGDEGTDSTAAAKAAPGGRPSARRHAPRDRRLPGMEEPAAEPVEEKTTEEPAPRAEKAQSRTGNLRLAATSQGSRTSHHPSAGVVGPDESSGEKAQSPQPAPVAPMAAFGGTSMTLQELSRECGLEESEVKQLEAHGLVGGRAIGGTSYYDEDALIVGRLASSFAEYGVEARHLRLHLLAAQREAGFIEQVVLPLLKQRNPASRQRAHDTVTELTRLGQELRGVLLRHNLRQMLGG
jgi:DNA-binding transcriptional MerR regulator